MAAKGFIEKLDWDSAIADCSAVIEGKVTSTVQPFSAPIAANIAGAYIQRCVARCFKADKESKHDDAIADLSNAISLSGADKGKAHYYRAFAYYLDGNYERAIADCEECCCEPQNCELLGKIYTAMGKYQEAAENFGNTLKHYYQQNTVLPPPSLLCDYIEACKKMNNG